MKEYDVIIVGGGVTGASTARDCAIRGLSTLLIERGDICDGASGRNHGLLHSGARYAVTDMEGARECIQENLILKRIARNCIDSVGGLFITLPEDGTDYRDNFISRCNEAGIETRLLSANEALELEPSLNPRLVSAVQVPDASVDPFHLTDVNIIDALRHGAQVLKFHRVTEFIVENGRVAGVKTEVRGVPAPREFRARMVVLAAGIWTAELAASVGIKINMLPSKGSLIIFGHRVSRMVVNRCRKPSNADILVPGGVVSVLGTTSDRVPMEEVDSICATPDEVDLLVREGAMLVPSLANTRVIRAYAGVRPLVMEDSGADGRSVSRGIVVLDHEERDGVPGLITITGGKLTTSRLMAEKVTDAVCRHLGNTVECTTAIRPLPGSRRPWRKTGDPFYKRPARVRHGSEVARMDFESGREIICECEHVTRAEITYAVSTLGVRNISDLRRHTRIGMGTCQGCFCVRKVARVLAQVLGQPEREEEFIRDYLQERWKGIVPVLWGDTLREAEYMQKIHRKDEV